MQATATEAVGVKSSVLMAALALLAPSTLAGVDDITWDADGRYEAHLRAESRAFVELCGPLTSGTRVDWWFEASAATDFNVHFHQGKLVEYPAKEAQVSISNGTLAASSDQDYCWMWVNKTAQPVMVQVRLARFR